MSHELIKYCLEKEWWKHETIKYGCLNIIHFMITMCCEEQSSFQDASYLAW